MASDLMLPSGFAPSNLHLRPSVKVRYINSDVYHIAERLASEVSTRLFVTEQAENGKVMWYVMEMCDDGVARFVAKFDHLEADAIHYVQKLLHIPFHVRVAALEKANEEWEREQHEEQLDQLLETVGWRMWRELEQCGFIQRPVSYAKRGIIHR